MFTDFFVQLLNQSQNDTVRQNLSQWATRRILFDIAGIKLPTIIGPNGEWQTDLSAGSSENVSPTKPDSQPDLTLQIKGADFVWLVQGFDALSKRAQIAGDAGLLEAVGKAFKDINPQQLWPSNPDSAFPMAQEALRAGFEYSIKIIPQAANQLLEHHISYWRDERAYLVTKEEMAQRDATLLSLSDAVARLEARIQAGIKTSSHQYS